MPRGLLLPLAGATIWIGCQPALGQDLATRLATPELREAAVETVVSSASKEQLDALLAWTHTPPAGINPILLNIGLAEVFGRLRAPEAVPFLVTNITLDVTGLSHTNTWMKNDSVVESQLPAMMALIAIGPPASEALIAAPWPELRPNERLAALYAISKIADPDALGFLRSYHPMPGREADLVKRGVMAIEGRQSGPQ